MSRWFALAALAVAVSACSDSTGPSSQITLSQIAGSWDLSRVEMLLAADTSVHQDVTAMLGGARISLNINRDGAGILVVAAVGQVPDSTRVAISLHGDTLVFSAEGAGTDYVVNVKIAGPSMSWRGLKTTSWDLDNDGSPETVYERDTWRRP